MRARAKFNGKENENVFKAKFMGLYAQSVFCRVLQMPLLVPRLCFSRNVVLQLLF